MSDNDNIVFYKLSINLLDKFLRDSLITKEEYIKCKNDFKLTYNIKEDVTFVG